MRHVDFLFFFFFLRNGSVAVLTFCCTMIQIQIKIRSRFRFRFFNRQVLQQGKRLVQYRLGPCSTYRIQFPTGLLGELYYTTTNHLTPSYPPTPTPHPPPSHYPRPPPPPPPPTHTHTRPRASVFSSADVVTAVRDVIFPRQHRLRPETVGVGYSCLPSHRQRGRQTDR